jgi:hypothetical protein
MTELNEYLTVVYLDCTGRKDVRLPEWLHSLEYDLFHKICFIILDAPTELKLDLTSCFEEGFENSGNVFL